MTDTHSHATHPDIVKRLRRADGHLKKIISMIEDQRPCLDIAQQLQAVESAIRAAKRTLVRDHIDHCLEDAISLPAEEGRSALEEFREITKYL